jgi:predicted DNA-binding transcriptional regulator YafY
MNPDYSNIFNADALDNLIDALRLAALRAEQEYIHAASPGTTDTADIALYAVSSIAGGPNLTIIYEDTDGVVSIRHIVVNSIERCRNGHTILRCYDQDRSDHRSFRLDRIKGAATEYRTLDTITWAM